MRLEAERRVIVADGMKAAEIGQPMNIAVAEFTSRAFHISIKDLAGRGEKVRHRSARKAEEMRGVLAMRTD
jgi:hypothetical protein